MLKQMLFVVFVNGDMTSGNVPSISDLVTSALPVSKMQSVRVECSAGGETFSGPCRHRNRPRVCR